MMVHSINQISKLDLISFIYETYEDINPLSFVFSFVFIFIFYLFFCCRENMFHARSLQLEGGGLSPHMDLLPWPLWHPYPPGSPVS